VIRVAVADDHAVVRAGLTRIIRGQSRMQIVCEASSVDEVLAMVREQTFDVLLLDVNLHGKTSLEAMKAIRAEHGRVAILVLSMYPEEQYAIRFIKAGASGYLTKDAAPEQLVEAITRVAAGGHYVTPQLAEMAVFGTQADEAAHKALSDREYEVMIGIARGKRIRELADEFALSEKTISTYRTRVLRKLSCASNADIVQYALSHSLLNDV
jgi:two-component system, NarL family, invasion response regulator UvrY